LKRPIGFFKLGVIGLEGEIVVKRILWVRTGGTIDMVYDEASESYVPAPKDLIKGVLKNISLGNAIIDMRDDVVDFIDSSEMTPEIWAKLATFLADEIKGYDGVLITHGTDTMHYTASALSFMLRNLNKPVVLTGAMIPIVEDGSDGVRNLLDSITFLVKGSIPGVFIVFDGKVIRGVRSRKVSTSDFSAFASINADYVGFVENGKLTLNSEELKFKGESLGELQADVKLDKNVVLIKLFPGINPILFEPLPSLGFRGVVVEAFGSGGARVKDPGSLVEGISYLRGKGIPVFITSQCSLKGVVRFGPKPYYVAKRLMEAGAISLKDMITEVAVVKLMWVLGHVSDYDGVVKLMLRNFAGEISEEEG